jgi:hypothetical protein
MDIHIPIIHMDIMDGTIGIILILIMVMVMGIMMDIMMDIIAGIILITIIILMYFMVREHEEMSHLIRYILHTGIAAQIVQGFCRTQQKMHDRQILQIGEILLIQRTIVAISKTDSHTIKPALLILRQTEELQRDVQRHLRINLEKIRTEMSMIPVEHILNLKMFKDLQMEHNRMPDQILRPQIHTEGLRNRAELQPTQVHLATPIAQRITAVRHPELILHRVVLQTDHQEAVLPEAAHTEAAHRAVPLTAAGPAQAARAARVLPGQAVRVVRHILLVQGDS